MKVLFMGTPDFSVPALESLVKAGHEITAVVTQPDRQRGRGHQVSFSPVKAAAVAHGIPVLQPQRIREEQWLPILQEYKPDIGVVIAFGQILPKSILDIPEYGCINVHASLLPKYRGASPIQHCIIAGEEKTGVTIMQMDEGLDTGDMIAKIEVPISKEETGGSLHDKLSQAGAALLLDVLNQIEVGTAVFEKQRQEDATYVGLIHKEMGLIDWKKPAVEIERLIRGLYPWPGAYTKLGKKTLKLLRADVVQGKPEEAAFGQVTEVTSKSVLVATGKDRLEITGMQLEGKKQMDAASFLRGCRIETGEILGGQR